MGDDVAKAEEVRIAMRTAGLSSKVIAEFEQADLVNLHNGRYTTAMRLQTASVGRSCPELCLTFFSRLSPRVSSVWPRSLGPVNPNPVG